MAEIKIDTSSITPEAQFQLAKGCLEFYYRIINHPGGRELLDKWRAAHPEKLEKE